MFENHHRKHLKDVTVCVTFKSKIVHELINLFFSLETSSGNNVTETWNLNGYFEIKY